MDFVLFFLVNATLFIRPAEISRELLALPIYNAIILANLVVAAPKVAGVCSPEALRRNPITVCVFGLLGSIMASQAARANFLLAREGGYDFAKIVLYYLLLVAVLDTPARLRRFLAALALFIGVLTSLALLHYYGVINIPALDAVADREVDAKTGEEYMVMRLCSTGIFNDPNDLSLMLILGIGACLFLAEPSRGRLPRPYWLVPAGLFLHALTLTHSRGGFLALLAGMMVLFDTRFGRAKAVFLACLVLPAMLVLFAGRQTNISVEGDTGQDRIQLWAAGLVMLRESPVFGIGHGLYVDRAGLVAHNSYIHAFAELGLVGGTFFLGAFAYAVRTLLRLGRQAGAVGGDLGRFRAFLLAIVAAYAFGITTLSRTGVVPTYLVLGLTTVFFRLAAAETPALAAPGGPILAVDGRLVAWMVGVAVVFVIAANGFVLLFVRW